MTNIEYLFTTTEEPLEAHVSGFLAKLHFDDTTDSSFVLDLLQRDDREGQRMDDRQD